MVVAFVPGMKIVPGMKTAGSTSIRWALVALLAAPAWAADRADLTGHVRVTGQPASTRPTMSAYVGSIGAMCCESTPDRAPNDPRDFVLFVEGLADSTPSGDGTVPELAQINQQFEPHVLGVPVGSTVSFPNQDPLFHNVFSYSRTKRFDLGKYGAGQTRTVTFDTPGLVQVFCEIHANMSANILVVDSSFVTQPDADGHYVLAGLPLGTHTLSIWHPDFGLQTRQVHITDAGVSLDLEF
jgi:plastocyanin